MTNHEEASSRWILSKIYRFNYYGRDNGKDWRLSNGLLILRHADRPKGQSEGHVDITDEGRKKSYALGKSIGNASAVVSSTMKRTKQTAEEIMSAIGHDFDSLRQFESLKDCVLMKQITQDIKRG
ncbi:MAG: hypothetical protein EBQ49_02005 [Verrucomicrobia bacterium]|nr:hypothetical protein [Verrucomicrobiota bacterium]